MKQSIGKLISIVRDAYEHLDRQVESFSRVTGLKCIEGCGACCEKPVVEATVLEVLPLAKGIYLFDKEEEILTAIRMRSEKNDLSCVLYEPDMPVPGNGRCTCYPERPLVCRLFGFAARRGKYGAVEFSGCRRLRQQHPEIVARTEMAVSNGIRPPLYQESFMRIAVNSPSLGFQRHPINRAILAALGQLQWERPKRPQKKAA